MWGDQPQRTVYLVESKEPFCKKEGHLLETWCRVFIRPKDDQDQPATSPHSNNLNLIPLRTSVITALKSNT